MLYRITFGSESREINAASADDAWAAFCSVNTTANRHPKLYERVIEEVKPPETADVEYSDVTPILEIDCSTGTVTLLQPAEQTAEVEAVPAMDPVSEMPTETTETTDPVPEPPTEATATQTETTDPV